MEKEVLTLTELGLTERQARVLLILTKCRFSTARAIALGSHLLRQDVYKVLDELQHLSFVQKKLGSPTTFVAVPISEVCSELLARRVEKTSDLMARTKVLVNNFKENESNTIADEGPGLFIVPEKRAFVHRLKKSVDRAKQYIDVITPRKFLNQGLFSLTDELKKAVERGVQIRFITNESPESDFEQAFPLEFTKNPGFKIKTITDHSSLRFCLYDKKEVSVVLSLQGDFAKSSLLWSNSVSLVDVFQDHFDMLWLAAKSHYFMKQRKRQKKRLISHY